MIKTPLSVILTLSVLTSCLADSSWNYRDVLTKQQAAAKATGIESTARLASLAGRAGLRKEATNAATTPTPATDAQPAAGGQGPCSEAMFDNWAAAFQYTFEGPQREVAMLQFCSNMERVKRVNSDLSLPYWLSGNAYSHLSFEQFSSQFLTITKPKRDNPPQTPSPTRKMLQTGSKASVDWVAAGKVTPIRSQGGCNSCWAFAAVAAIESSYLIGYGGNASDPAVQLSEQQLVSCATPPLYNSYGCNSGSSDSAINYARDNKLTLRSLYPYTGQATQCNANIASGSGSGKFIQLQGSYIDVPWNNEAEMIKAVEKAPVIVYFAVDESFSQYAGGVYAPRPDNSHNVNHALVIVGYDTTSASNRYWTLKNSWGTSWGEKGFARVKMTGSDRNGQGACGMYMWPMQPPSKFTSPPLTSAPTLALNGVYGQISATTRTKP